MTVSSCHYLKFISAKVRYKSSFHAARSIVKEEGFRALYRGIVPAVTLTSNSAISMLVYEQLRKLMLRLLPSVTSDSGAKEKFPVSLALLMGGLSKSISTVSTYPLMLIRSRLYQRATDDAILSNEKKQMYGGIKDVFTRVIKHEGIKGFYKGLSIHLIKTAPSAALTFSCYEYLIRITDNRW